MNSVRMPDQGLKIDGMTWVAIGFIAFLMYVIVQDALSSWEDHSREKPGERAGAIVRQEEASGGDNQIGGGELSLVPEADMTLISAPYEDYIITQGPHGFSYGHMAIDLAAGKGAKIRSPINGVVTELYIDEWGNPTLVIENEIYRVTLLHGKFKVQVGDIVEIGQIIGKESNQGYTTDMAGRSCRNRECGYHTHLNVFDKRIGSNVNPLDLIRK